MDEIDVMNPILKFDEDDNDDDPFPEPLKNESIVGEISQIIRDRFETLPRSVYKTEIERACGLLGEALGMQHVVIWRPCLRQPGASEAQLEMAYCWSDPDVKPIPVDCRRLNLEAFGVLNSRFSRNEAMLLPNIEDEFSKGMKAEKSFLKKIHCLGMAMFPLTEGEKPGNMVSYLPVHSPIALTERFVADVTLATDSLSAILQHCHQI